MQQKRTSIKPPSLPPPVEPPTWPHTEVNLGDHGLLIVIALAPGTQISQLLPPETMNEVCAKWLEAHKPKKSIVLLDE